MSEVKHNVIFRWGQGGKRVNLAGTFNGWRQQPMNKKSDGLFELEIPLSNGTYEYKFIVDGVWKYDPKLSYASDENGNINNIKKLETSPDCVFCKIVRGQIPSIKITETDCAIVFMDISPLSSGHCLVVPKYHCQKLHELPPEEMADVGPLMVRVAKAVGAENYNIIQNNGSLAHQAVDHVHFHIIPKPSPTKGLVYGKWVTEKVDNTVLNNLAEEIKGRLE